MYYLLGIDDTDSSNNPQNTAALALALGRHLEAKGLAQMIHLSCHELAQLPAIAKTNQNIASCLLIDAEEKQAREIDLVCREKLHRESAVNSNPGYALAAWNQFDPEIVIWGKTAKINPLNRQDAIVLARRCNILTAGINGSGAGVIGALAAIGLRYEGNDGWIEWMPGLEALHGVYSQVKLARFIRFDLIETESHKKPAMDDRIQINPPLKPLLIEGRIVLRVSIAKRGSDFEWQTG